MNFIARCSICNHDIPFRTREEREKWSQVHFSTLHPGAEGEQIRITLFQPTWAPPDTDKQMRQRLARAKADALIEFAQSLPEPWNTLRLVAPTGPEVTMESLLRQRAEEIIEEAG